MRIDFDRMRALIQEEERLRWAVERQQAKCTRITASISGEPRGGGGKSTKEDQMIALAEMREEHQKVKTELKELRKRLRAVIGRKVRNNVQREVLKERYLRGTAVQEIAAEFHYSERHTVRILRIAESKINQGARGKS